MTDDSRGTDLLQGIGGALRDTAVALGAMDKDVRQNSDAISKIENEIWGHNDSNGLRDRVKQLEIQVARKNGNGDAVKVAQVQGQYSTRTILIQSLFALLSAIIGAIVAIIVAK